MQTGYPIVSLTSPDGTLTVTPSEANTGQDYPEVIWQGWCIRYRPEVDAKAGLVYCPEPDEGLSPVQAREQTSYDVWITYSGSIPPKLYQGEMESREPKVSEQRVYLALNWGNYVGASSLRLERPGMPPCTLEVEVRSCKLDYLSDYRHLLDEISDHVTSLIFDYGSSTAVYHGRASHDIKVAYLDYLFLRYLMDPARLPRHFQLVAKAPHQTTQRRDTWVDLSQVHRVSVRTITNALMHPEHLARITRQTVPPIVDSYVPTRLLDERVITTFDTPPNRFVKHFLNLLITKLHQLEQVFAGEAKHLAGDCLRWRRTLTVSARAHFLEAVGEMHLYPAGSQVLLKQEGYRQLNDYYRRFLLTGRVAWDGWAELIRTPNKDLATLYEYWGYFELLKAVSGLVQKRFDRQNILHFGQAPPYDFRISLNQQGRCRATVENIKVFYNRYFTRRSGNSYSVTLHPDYAIQLGETDLIILDAKYRLLDLSRWIDSDPASQDEESRVYQKSDLYKMHTYRDALKARAVFILYPGEQFRAYSTTGRQPIEDPDKLPPDFAGVGAIPCSPQQTAVLHSCLQRLLFRNT